MFIFLLCSFLNAVVGALLSYNFPEIIPPGIPRRMIIIRLLFLPLIYRDKKQTFLAPQVLIVGVINHLSPPPSPSQSLINMNRPVGSVTASNSSVSLVQ